MHARSTTLQGRPEHVDEVVRYVRDDVMTEVPGEDGFVGLSMLVDRTAGRCIVTTAWESRDALRASDGRVRASRQRAAEVLGSSTSEVAEWEVALVHRAHAARDGARTRVIWSTVPPDRMEHLVEDFRTAMMDRVEELPGFCSLSMLVDRDGGRCVLTVGYDDQASLDRAASRAAALRQEADERLGMRIAEVAVFDLAIAHLRVPETV